MNPNCCHKPDCQDLHCPGRPRVQTLAEKQSRLMGETARVLKLREEFFQHIREYKTTLGAKRTVIVPILIGCLFLVAMVLVSFWIRGLKCTLT